MASILIAVALFAFGSMFAGADYLLWILPGGMPLGNALAAVGLTSAAGAAYGVSRPRSFLRWLSVTSLFLSVIWLPVSIGLAGNLELNLSGRQGDLWLHLSLVTFVLAIISLIWALARTVSGKGRRNGTVRAA